MASAMAGIPCGLCVPLKMQHGSFQGGGMCNKTMSCLEKSLFNAVVSSYGSVLDLTRTCGAILLFLSLF